MLKNTQFIAHIKTLEKKNQQQIVMLLQALDWPIASCSSCWNTSKYLFDLCQEMTYIPLDEDTKVQLLCNLNALYGLEFGFKFDRMHTFYCPKYGRM